MHCNNNYKVFFNKQLVVYSKSVSNFKSGLLFVTINMNFWSSFTNSPFRQNCAFNNYMFNFVHFKNYCARISINFIHMPSVQFLNGLAKSYLLKLVSL